MPYTDTNIHTQAYSECTYSTYNDTSSVDGPITVNLVCKRWWVQWCPGLTHKTCLCLEQKYTYTYNSLQFPAEMKTSGSKTPTTFITLHINYDYRWVD